MVSLSRGSTGRALHDYWNHNAEHHPRVLDAVPEGCTSALDVGCGEGLLVRKLARRVRTVVGVDRSPEMVRLARERAAEAPNARFVAADFVKGREERASAAEIGRGYGFVCAVTVVHHAGFAEAVEAMTSLLAPGGRLVIVGIAADGTPFDRALGLAAVAANPVYRRLHGGEGGMDGMPVARPTMSWRQVREESKLLLPGRRYRRHLLWRYSLMWDKP
ncbi:class I SAM-dependent methyltransferase [Streptomyces fuscigenes]|uniref:class I SAM-dependent methyltransferase n=1 Tax=Streptomyces fuscigenes TaxID=1528880 RepID=UPI001F218E97|nr:class I SAM-dependent methyltransferase [Streptomyces fuscigenes]MCF3962804.1 class I SAM-dependent methyltransferase [Streptomyces fuscigenes]